MFFIDISSMSEGEEEKRERGRSSISDGGIDCDRVTFDDEAVLNIVRY